MSATAHTITASDAIGKSTQSGLPPVSRRQFLGAAAGVLGAAALARPARAQSRIQIGYIPLLTVGPLFVAHDRGYLREAGLDVEMIRFNSGAEMVVALGTGELAVGYGNISPGLYNSWSRGVRTSLVADGSQMRAGYSSTNIVARPGVIETLRGPADLRGRRVGMSLVGSAIDYVVRNLLEQNGLTIDDVDAIRLPSAEVNAGLAGNSLDVAGVGEPFGTLAEINGFARRWMTGDQIMPGMQVGGVLLSDQFARDRSAAVAFVTAWLRGTREFLPGQSTDPAILEIVSRWSGVQTDVIRRATPTYCDPNGTMNLEDLRRQQAFWIRHGVLTAPAPLDERVDASFAEAAVQTLGRA